MTGETLKTVPPPLGQVRAAVWNHDSSKLLIADCSETGAIVVWDGKWLTEDRRLVKERRLTLCVSWNHDSSKIISSRQGLPIQIWDAESGALLNSLIDHSIWIGSVFWNHDDSKIFSGSEDGTIRIWDGTIGQLLTTGSFDGRVEHMRLTKERDRIAFSASGFIRCLTVSNL
jgi:WD40 repeat protein